MIPSDKEIETLLIQTMKELGYKTYIDDDFIERDINTGIPIKEKGS